MEAYRDQYASLFKNGRNVVVIGVSVDADTTQAAWAREKEFPVLFASDAGRPVYERMGYLPVLRLTMWHRPPRG